MLREASVNSSFLRGSCLSKEDEVILKSKATHLTSTAERMVDTVVVVTQRDMICCERRKLREGHLWKYGSATCMQSGLERRDNSGTQRHTREDEVAPQIRDSVWRTSASRNW